MVKKDIHYRIPEITARALSAKTKNYAKTKPRTLTDCSIPVRGFLSHMPQKAMFMQD